jgi:hypothetical protein
MGIIVATVAKIPQNIMLKLRHRRFPMLGVRSPMVIRVVS